MLPPEEEFGEPESSRQGPPRRPFFAVASSAYATQLTVAALSLVNVLIVSRALGPTGRGEVVFLITISFLSAQIATLSISEAASNIAGRFPAQRPAVATNSLAFAVGLGGLAAGLLAFLLLTFPSIGPQVSLGLRVLALAVIPALILQSYAERIVIAEYGFTVVYVAWLMPPSTNVTLNALLAGFGHLSVTSAFVVWVSGQVAGALLLVWFIQRRLAGFGRPNVALAKHMATFGLKAHGGRILMWGNYRLDQWLVGAIAGSRQLGLYSVAVAYAEGLFLLPQALMVTQRPDLVRASPAEAGRRAAAGFRVATLATLVLVIAVVLAAPFLCIRVFGSAFAGSVPDLRMLAGGAFGIAAMKILGSALVAQRKPLREGTAIACAFALTIALDLLLIPRHGGFGAATASTVAYTVGGAAIVIIASRSLHTPLASFLPRGADFRSGRLALRGALSRRRESHE